MKVPPSKESKPKKAPLKKAPLKVVLDREQRMVLEEIARTLTYPYRDVIRARTILMLADGVSQAEVSRRVGMRRRIVRKWAERFVDEGLRGLNDAPRSGRPPRFSPDRGDSSGQAGVRVT
jgi:Winged helix-turn helix